MHWRAKGKSETHLNVICELEDGDANVGRAQVRRRGEILGLHKQKDHITIEMVSHTSVE